MSTPAASGTLMNPGFSAVRRILIPGLLALLASFTDLQAAGVCAGNAACTEVKTFAATVTDFRTSAQGRYRYVTMTVRFQNTASKALTLGYVQNSGLVIDDQGNRYGIGAESSVRGIGWITGASFDPKFTLQPGETSDARFEFVYKPTGNDIFGTKYDVDLAIREINAVTADQFRLGQEHALHYSGMSKEALAATPATAPAPAAAAAAAAPHAPATAATPSVAPAAPVDPCAGAPRCSGAGPFVAQIAQLTADKPGGRHHSLRLNVKFRNLTGQPIILAYQSGSSSAVDNLGNRYVYGRPSTHDTSVQGIGYVTGRSADAQFVLNPGETRAAAFNVIRFNSGASQIGTAFNYDVVIQQLEILPSQQVRTVRDYSLNFASLSANMPELPMPGMTAAAGTVPTSGEQVATEVTKQILDLFKKKPKD